MILAVGFEVWLGTITGVFASIGGTYAVVKGSRADADSKKNAASAAKSAAEVAAKATTREDVQQVIDAQVESLKLAWDRAVTLETRLATVEGVVETTVAKLAECERRHVDRDLADADRERRLHLAEARIAELGG